jgi:hypothetical protein
MTTPNRWKDDAAFIRDSGIDLNHEASAVGGYRLQAMRASVVAGELPVASGPSAIAVAAGAGIALVGAGLLWLAFSPVEVASIDLASEQAPAVAAVQGLSVPLAAPLVQPLAKKAVEVASLPPAAVEPVGAPPQAAPAGTDDVPADEADEAQNLLPRTPEPQVSPTSGTADAPSAGRDDGRETDLAQQRALYIQGRDALDSGELSAANSAFGRYLEDWPQGVLRDEVLVSILEVLVRQSAWSDAERVAASFLSMPDLQDRRTEISRVRAEALVHLNRCDEAMALAAGLERTDQVSIRKTCRAGAR